MPVSRSNQVFACLILLTLTIVIIPTNIQACTWTTPFNQDVEPGETAHYYVRAWNTDHPLGVDVKFEIEQDISGYDSQNIQFHLYPGEEDTMTLQVHTRGITANEIHTNVTFYEMDARENEWDEDGAVFFTTRIHHPEVEEEVREDAERSGNIFLAVTGFSLVGLAIYLFYHRQAVTVSVMPGYTRLRKDLVLKNEIRRDILVLLYDYNDGLTLGEIQRELGIQHRRLAQYHLQKLLEFNFVRKIDNEYFPAGVEVGRPFITKIRDAVEEGARTPGQVARQIGSYREKVRYHMKKHGMW